MASLFLHCLDSFVFRTRGFPAVAAFLIPFVAPVSAQISFDWLEGMSSAWAVSSDGSIALGAANAGFSGSEPARWTKSGGITLIPSIPGVVDSRGTLLAGMSSDGSVVVGTQLSGTGALQAREQAFRWTAETGTVGLGTLPGRVSSRAVAVSADGSTIVGQSESLLPGVDLYVPPQAFRYTTAAGMTPLVSSVPSEVTAMSASGNIVLGSDDHGSFRWDAGVGTSTLFPGAMAISPNGEFIVGGGYGPNVVPFRWSSATGIVPLENLPIDHGQGGFATAVSNDGDFILGMSFNQHFQGFPFIWTPNSGARGLLDVLLNVYGLSDEFEGWSRISAYGMSDNGRFLVGSAFAQSGIYQAWMLDLGLDRPVIPPGEAPPPFQAVPEPGIYGLMGALMLGAIAIARRARSPGLRPV